MTARNRTLFDLGPSLVVPVAVVLTWVAPLTQAQIERPVYVDDSPRAAEGLVRAQELAAIGNLDEAVRVLQQILDDEGTRVLPLDEDQQLFIPVRRHVHQVLFDDPELLDRYRELMGPRAGELLEAGDVETVERALLLTTAGLEATLRLAQQRLEGAMFEAAHLTMLELEDHPDRRGERRTEAAQLLSLIASYVGAEAEAQIAQQVRDAAARDAARWRQQAGLADADPIVVDMPRFQQTLTPLQRGEETDLAGLVQGPPWSARLGADTGVDNPRNRRGNRAGARETQRLLYVMPTIWGDMAYTSNGRTITAWNRFTLEQVWVAEEPSDSFRLQAGGQQRVVEPTLVAIGRGLVVGLSGVGFHSNRQAPNRRIFARDAMTGVLVWSVRLEQIIPDRTGTTVFTGPPVIDQGAVIVGIDRDDQQRRLDGATLVALDLRDGSTRWVRSLGSSGSINFQSTSGGITATREAGGVLYGAHRLGFVFAIESATGRVRWIRRDRSSAMPLLRLTYEPWELAVPLLRQDVLFVLSPNRSAIYELDRRTGAIRSQMPSSQLASPAYLLEARDMLIGVSRNEIFGIPFDEFGTGKSGRSVGSLEGKVIRGRTISTGDLLMTPTEDSLRVFAPNQDDLRPIDEIALDRTGNILPLDSELLVIDDREIHAYLVWDIAHRMLRERLDRNPDDAATPITFAELAFRAGQFELVVELIDATLNIVDRDPLAHTSEQALERMFEALRNMIEGEAQYAASARPSMALQSELLVRLGRCATTTPQRAAFLILRGEHYRNTNDLPNAVEQFQQILDSLDLAQAPFQRGASSLSAGYEAALLLRTLVREHGPDLYEPYEAEAQRRLAELTQELNPAPFEAIAQRYPVAPAAAQALAEAASCYERQGHPLQAAQALEEAVRTARAAAIDPNDSLRGEITGRLVLHYLQARRIRLAQDHLERFALESPNSALTEGGNPLDVTGIRAEIDRALRLQPRRPRIGAHVVGSKELVGWSIESSLAFDASSSVTDRVMMRSSDDIDMLAMWTLNQEGMLEKTWTSREKDELFLWLDRRGVFMMREEGEGDRRDPVIILRDADTGEIRWQTESFRSMIGPGPIDAILERPEAAVPRLDIPNPGASGQRPAVTEIRGEFDERTLVLADRMGRLVGIDLASGQVLWSQTDVVARLYDLDVELGTVLVGGSDAPLNLNDPQGGRAGRRGVGSAVAVALDARNGQRIGRAHRMAGDVRWVRLAPEGVAVVGTQHQVATFGLYLDDDGWSSNLEVLRGTSDAWALKSRVLLRREQDDQLHQIRTIRGPELMTLETRDLLEGRFGNLRVEPIDDNALVMTSNGMTIFGPEGEIVGRDLRERAEPVLLMGVSQRYIPALSRSIRQEQDAIGRFVLTFYTTESLRTVSRIEIEAGAEPHSMAILDGKVLISSGAITTIIDVPSEDESDAGNGAP